MNSLSEILDYKASYIRYTIGILCLDALAVIPFAYLRQQQHSLFFAIVKIGNVCVNICLNIVFFWVLDATVFEDKVDAIMLALLIPSLLTLLVLSPVYMRSGLAIDWKIWKQMLRYGFPVLIAGVAFAVNESFDRLFLNYLLPKDIAEAQVGIYSACYKFGMFMTLFITAFKLGIEPFFFQQAKKKKAQTHYAIVTYYFSLLGAIILMFVSVYTPFLKYLIVPKETYWEGLWIVPIILLANLCLGIYHNLSVWYKITDKTHFGAIFSIIGSLVTIFANIVMIPKIGYKGSALATLCAYGTMMLLSYTIGQYHYPVPYRTKRILVITGVASVISILYFYYSDHNLLLGSIFFLAFVGTILYSERTLLKEIFKK